MDFKETYKSPKSPKSLKKIIYCCDYLNLFSDYREIKYKKDNIDFHEVKHNNKEKDTIEFFRLFFTKYIKYVNINRDSNFIFVMKKITNYNDILYKILEIYNDIDIRFIIIESKYKDNIVDKSKDDFLCQYIFQFLVFKNDNCVLISNDKYRDRDLYIKIFQSDNDSSNDNLGETQIIKVIQKKNGELITEDLELKFEKFICISLSNQIYKRTVIPKNKLLNII